MIADAGTTVRLEATFPNLSLARPVLDKLSQCPCVATTILHGRLSRDEARFSFEVTGCSDEIAELVRVIRQWGTFQRVGAQTAP